MGGSLTQFWIRNVSEVTPRSHPLVKRQTSSVDLDPLQQNPKKSITILGDAQTRNRRAELTALRAASQCPHEIHPGARGVS